MRKLILVALLVALSFGQARAVTYTGNCAIWAMKRPTAQSDYVSKFYEGSQTGYDAAKAWAAPNGYIQIFPGCDGQINLGTFTDSVQVNYQDAGSWKTAGARATVVAPRLGPASSPTTGGAIRIVDGVTFPLTGAGVVAAVADLPARGGRVIVGADSINFGTTQLTINKSYVTIEGAAERATVFEYTGSGRFIQFGTDDGNHSGVPNAYDGLASFVTLKNLRLKGPGKTSTATAITDWDGGSNKLENVTIDSWGVGYFGIGADVSTFKVVLWSNNGRAIYLGSRCDRMTIDTNYFTQNAVGIWNQWAYAMTVTNSQFSFSDSADIVYDVTASPAGSGDVRTGSQRATISGTWFEYLSSPAHHLQLGINGTSARYMTGLTFIGNEWFSSNTDTLVSVQAFGDVDMYGNGYSGSAATLLRVNPVSGWQPIIHDFMNHMASTITPLVGTGDTTYVYRTEPAYSPTGWVFKTAVTMPGSNGTASFPATGDRLEFSGSGANLINAVTGNVRLMAANTTRLEANTLGVDIVGRITDTGVNILGDDTNDTLRVNGRLDMNNSIIQREGVNIASAATITIGNSNFYTVTGTTTSTDIAGPAMPAGKHQLVTFYTTAGWQITKGNHWKINGNFNGNATGDKDSFTFDWDGTDATEVGRVIQ